MRVAPRDHSPHTGRDRDSLMVPRLILPVLQYDYYIDAGQGLLYALRRTPELVRSFIGAHGARQPPRQTIAPHTAATPSPIVAKLAKPIAQSEYSGQEHRF